MAGLVESLTSTLTEQNSLYKEIILLLSEKKEYIIKNDIEALRGIIDKENSVTAKALRAEKKRAEIMKNISIVLNKNQDILTFDFLINSLENKPGQKELKEIVSEIRETSEKMKEINDSVRSLVENALEYIDYSINVIHTSSDFNSQYPDSDGESSFLDING